MPTRRALLGGIAAAAPTSLAGCSNPLGEREYYREFGYQASVNPTGPVTGITLSVPAPVLDDAVAIEGRLDDGIVPEAWALSIVETDRGPMLAIETDELRPPDGPYSVEIHWTVEAEIDTRNALQNEPTLRPKDDVEQVECDFPHPDDWDDRLRCYSYVGSISGAFEPTGTSVSVSASFFGANSWHQGGWSGNDYDDSLHGYVDGTGWTDAQGSFREGSGTY